MKNIQHICKGIVFLILVMGFTNTSIPKKEKLQLEFKHFVKDELLKLDSVSYKNELGQTYSVTKFKYYIGNIRLKKTNGTELLVKNYFLINEDEPASKKIEFPTVPLGNYESISFTLGVDSIDNCNGAQSGALDPINAMFWTWNTGYVFLKLEGTSPESKSPGSLFEFHIGGYKQASNCIRNIELHIENNNQNTLQIKVDVNKVLGSTNKIDFSKYSSITDFHNASFIADNYKNMFSILKNEK